MPNLIALQCDLNCKEICLLHVCRLTTVLCAKFHPKNFRLNQNEETRIFASKKSQYFCSVYENL